MATPTWLQQSLQAKKVIEKSAEKYEAIYNDSVDERFKNARLEEKLKESDIGGYYTLNLARSAVDAPLERTEIQGIICADGRGRTVLEDFWTLNELDFEADVVHEKAFQSGHSVVLLMPDENGELQAYVHSPKDVAVFYDPARPRLKSHAVHTYIATDGDGDEFSQFDQSQYYFVEVYTANSIQKWRSTTAIVDGVGVDVSSVDMTMVEEIKNPVPGKVAAIHFRTARTPTGRSRLADVAGPQLAINDVLTAMMASIKAAGYRQRYLISEKSSEGDNFSDSGSDGIVDENQHQAGPDTILEFSGKGVKVGSFDVTQSSNFIEPIDMLAGYLAQEADLPKHYFSTGAQAPSGESYRQGERPLQSVVEHCESLFGASWAELFDYVLAYYGVPGAEAQVEWAPMTVDDKDFWETQEIKVRMGMPRKVAFIKSGEAQETVDEWFEDAKKKNTSSSNTEKTGNPADSTAQQPLLNEDGKLL